MFDGISSSIEHVKAGSLRPLATTVAMRWRELPDVPAMSEFLAWVRGECVVRSRRAKKHARQNHRAAQSRDQCRLADSKIKNGLAIRCLRCRLPISAGLS